MSSDSAAACASGHRTIAVPGRGRVRAIAGALGVLILSAPAPVPAQSRATGGDLVGVVVDQTEAVLRGAAVAVTEQATNLRRTTTTDAEGRFAVLALAPGRYRVEAEAPGFARLDLGNMEIGVGAVVDVTLRLRLAGLREDISVAPATLLVDPHETAIAHTIGQVQVEALPINRRSFIGFTLVTPGVTSDNIPQQTQGATPTSGLTFAGQRPRSNNVTVDGVDSNDAAVGAVRATVSQEAVLEYQVLAGSYSAEFGKAAGGVVNIVTKSGTNAARGDAFLFRRDDSLNAKGYFERFDLFGQPISQPKAPFAQWQWGGILGGPLRRDRTFYFASFERQQLDASNFVAIDDRTIVLDPMTGAPLGTPAGILRSAGFPVETGNVPYAAWSNTLLVKTDHRLTPQQHVAVRFTWARALDENVETFGGIIARSRAGAQTSVDRDLVASQTWVASARTVNELRFQWADRDQALRALDPLCGGTCDREDQGGPTLEVIGVASVGRQRVTPFLREAVRSQLVETLTHLRASHQLKAGLDASYIADPSYRLPLHFGGRYIFTALPAIAGVTPAPLSSIQALALGIPAAYVQGYGNPAGPYGYGDLSLFAQDDWRPRRSLTVKYGIRYQRQFWPDRPYTVPGVPEPYPFPSPAANAAPRVAAAWTPRGSERTSVHAAYGIFYELLPTSLLPVTRVVDGETGVRTLALRAPASMAAWAAPGRRLPEPARVFPSVRFAIDPGLKTPFAHQVSAGIDRQIGGGASLAVNFIYARGFNEIGTVDYNPLVPSLGPGRRPEDVNGVAGTSASILQYTSFGETWYRGLTLSVRGRLGPRSQWLASYTLSQAEDTSTDFQSAFIVQNTGRGRDRSNPRGLPVGFDPASEKGPSTQDQRHRFVASGIWPLPGAFEVSGIVTVASGRPYNILAGVDLNGDGDSGAFPSDRPRFVPGDPTTSIPRNSGRLPAQATVDLRLTRRFLNGRTPAVDAILEVFNLFNRPNFVDANNIFGTGAYPTSPLPTFGLVDQAGPPRQVQLGIRLIF